MKDRINKIIQKKENRILIIFIMMFITIILYSYNISILFNINLPSTDVNPDDVTAGYEVLFNAGLAFGTIIASIFYFILYIFLPIIVASISIIFGIVSRLFMIGEKKKWKNTVAKVLNVLSVVGYILISLFLLFSIKLLFLVNIITFIISLIIALTLLAVTIYLIIIIFKH